MTDLQRALLEEWVKADKAVSKLISEKPAPIPGNAAVLLDWSSDYYAAIGYRDGLHRAGVLAEVPNFKE